MAYLKDDSFDIEIKDEKKSKFNAAVAKLERIDFIRRFIHSSRIDDDFVNWSKGLKCWRAEVNERMNSEEKNVANEFQQTIDKIIRIYTLNKNNNKIIKLDITPLDEYELFLGSMENKYGLSLPDKEDILMPDEAW